MLGRESNCRQESRAGLQAEQMAHGINNSAPQVDVRGSQRDIDRNRLNHTMRMRMYQHSIT